MDKSCARPHKDWFQQEQRMYTNFSFGTKHEHELRCEDSISSAKNTRSYQLVPRVNHTRHFPRVLDTCYEIKWLVHSLTKTAQTLDLAVKQFGGLLLVAVTLLLLSVHVTFLIFILSSAATLPLGFQFLMASVFFISAIAFNLMYSL